MVNTVAMALKKQKSHGRYPIYPWLSLFCPLSLSPPKQWADRCAKIIKVKPASKNTTHRFYTAHLGTYLQFYDNASGI